MRHAAALLPLLLLLLPLPAPRAAAGEDPPIRIVAHPGLGIARVDAQLVRRVYLGQPARVGDTVLVPALLREDALQEAFARRYLQRTASQFMTYWRQQVFAGKGLPPRSFDTEAKLLEFLRSTPGAIAFLPGKGACEGVLVLEVEG